MGTSAGAIYHKLVIFRNDPSEHQLICNDSSPDTQAYIQTVVCGLGLEFEYSFITNVVRIIRHASIQAQPAEDEILSLLEFKQAYPSGGELPDFDAFPISTDINP